VLRICLRAHGGSQITTGKEDVVCGCAVLSTLSECLEIELSDFEAEDVTPRGDYLWLVVENAIGGIPTFLEVRFMFLLISLGRIQLQGFVATILFDPMRDQVDFRKDEVGI
jgi:hypothetical protein